MRKFIVIIGILLGTVLLAFIGMGVFLMLAPGTKLFGVKYIKATNEYTANVTKSADDLPSGDIIIETYGVPVTIEYTTSGSFEFHFVQKFNGFTKSNIEKPSLSVSSDENGNMVVKTNEFVPFIWGSNNSGYSLVCKIPSVYTNKKLTFSSSQSSVKIKTAENASAIISELTVVTKGSISLAGSLNIASLIASNVKKSIKIPQSVTLGNVRISQSGSKSTTINGNVTGNIEYSSSNGSLTFVSCDSLSVKTKNGSVKSSATDVSVNGNAVVNTKRGKVVLQKVTGDLNITTTSGKVYIGNTERYSESGCDGKVNITTTSGNVYLFGIFSATDKTVTINTKSGDVKVGDNSRTQSEKESGALASIKTISISTTRGDVSVESITNATISTTSGKVEIGKFNKAKITTKSGAVNVAAGTLAAELDVKTTAKNGNVIAKDLTGPTTISAKGKINVTFSAVFGKIDIVGADKDVRVVLPDSITTADHYFWIESSRISATIHIGSVEESTKKYHSVETIPDGGESKLIRVTSEKGKIFIANAKFA